MFGKTKEQIFPYLLIFSGIMGVFSAGILIVEKIQLLKNPGSKLGCDLNPIVSCGSVIDTWQASVFGFPNPLIGLVGFGAMATIGLAILAGAKFKRWFWLTLQYGMLFGICFVTWLQFQSLYNIGALCPFCMVVWSVTIPAFIYTTLYNLKNGYIKTPKNLKKAVEFAQKHHLEILISWYLVIVLLIAERFWYYWQTII